MVDTPVEHASTEPGSARLRLQVLDILESVGEPTPRHLLQDLLACRGVAVDFAQLSRGRLPVPPGRWSGGWSASTRRGLGFSASFCVCLTISLRLLRAKDADGFYRPIEIKSYPDRGRKGDSRTTAAHMVAASSGSRPGVRPPLSSRVRCVRPRYARSKLAKRSSF
jgi:hypothetical protein